MYHSVEDAVSRQYVDMVQQRGRGGVAHGRGEERKARDRHLGTDRGISGPAGRKGLLRPDAELLPVGSALLLESLPQGELDRFTVLRWQEQMLEKGYRLSTIKHRVSSANRLLAYLGLWEFQSEPPAQTGSQQQPQLTRREYLQLLRAARSRGRPGRTCSSRCLPARGCPSTTWSS